MSWIDKNLCHVQYQWESHELECLEKGTDICNLADYRGDKLICTCDLRIFIEKNLDKWMAKSAAI